MLVINISAVLFAKQSGVVFTDT